MTKKINKLSPYKKEYAEQAYKLALFGATRDELADFFKVSSHTIRRWMLAHEEFDEALRAGRMAADAEVAAKLFNRACGTTIKKQKVLSDGSVVDYKEELPPDTRAAETWLACRTTHNNGGRGHWVAKQQVELSGDAENPLAFIMGEVASEGEDTSALPSGQANFRNE